MILLIVAAVSARSRLEAVFQPVSPWLCLGDHLPYLGSASNFLPRPLLGLVIFGSAWLSFASALAVSKVLTLCHCCVTIKFVGLFEFTTTVFFTLQLVLTLSEENYGSVFDFSQFLHGRSSE